jgi:dTDP-glucose 4,6-dehydratase
MEFVSDRPGHDSRYAINTEKIENDFSWEPKYSFEKGIKETINWYLGKIKL